MAFIQCDFHSGVLGKACRMTVIVPQKSPLLPGKRRPGTPIRKYRVLYLLHGLSDDNSMWSRRTSIERYADANELAVVMPDGGRSFYTDMESGPRYWTFLADELPEIVASLFPVSEKREDTFAAGLSMGGYGALKLGLRHPERFAAIGALSAVTDIRGRMNSNDGPDWRREFSGIFGSIDDLTPRGNDLFALAAELKGDSPRFISICGTEDFLYRDNLRFSAHMKSFEKFDFTFEEHPGTHNWFFWDLHIQRVLNFMLRREH